MKMLLNEPPTTAQICHAIRGSLQALALHYCPNEVSHPIPKTAQFNAPVVVERLLLIGDPNIAIQVALILKGGDNCNALNPARDLSKALSKLSLEQMTNEELIYIAQMVEGAITQAIIQGVR